MAAGALGALIFGKLFDKLGLAVVLAVFFLSSFFAPLVFLGKAWIALLGMVLWGIGMSAQGSLLTSVIAGVIHASKRSTAFGVFDTGFGVAWFLGSWLMGVLYQKSIPALIVFSVLLQLVALPVFIFAKRNERR
jgi:predicted MFS family arabinose efflux permease